MRHSRSLLNTFWDKTRITCGLTVTGVGKIMGVSKSTASAYLSGLCMPSKTKVIALCEACGIDYDTGYHEFSKAYNTWEKNHPGCIRNGNSFKKVSESTVSVPLYTPEPTEDQLSSFNIPPKKVDNRGKYRRTCDTINTFWSRKKIELGISYREISEAIHKPITTVSHYFTGHMVPSVDTVKAICKVFNVDYAVGAAEFVKIANEYSERNNRYHYKNAVQQLQDVAAGATQPAVPEPVVQPIIPEPVTPASVDYLELLYGKISFEDFQLIYTAAKTKEDILPFVYGQIDYKTYCQIAAAL